MNKNNEYKKIEELGTIEEKCVEFAKILGLSEPVSQKILLAAFQNTTYAHNLLACREDSELLGHLLKNPPKVTLPEEEKIITNVEILKKLTKSLVQWGKTGFSTVSQETFLKRFNACLSCPNLKDPPKSVLYKVIGDKEKICNLCGCAVSKKARLTSESCPDIHPDFNDLTRWEESRDLS